MICILLGHELWNILKVLLVVCSFDVQLFFYSGKKRLCLHLVFTILFWSLSSSRWASISIHERMQQTSSGTGPSEQEPSIMLYKY